jgi:uncharacterized integral membrane protein
MRFFKLILASVLLLLGVMFVFHNLEVLNQKLQFKFDTYIHTFQSGHVSLWVLILFFFFLGLLTATLYLVYEVLKLRRENRHLRHNLEILASELQAFRPQEAAPAPEPPPAPAPEPTPPES